MSAADGPTPQRAPPLDARGLLCPLPVIRVQDRVKQLSGGDVLDVTATDPGTLHDIPAWCRVHGHRLLAAHSGRGDYRFRIEVRRDVVKPKICRTPARSPAGTPLA